MCGICGYIDITKNGSDLKPLIQRMNERLTHRGPDADGFYIEEHIALAMRRLKVIDLETGNQPLYNENKRLCVFFNGEIYNYKEIRTKLKKRGHVFLTQSDTEVIVHAYEEYGLDCFNYLNGMFGICIYDSDKRQIIVARDRLGIKPLYYVNDTRFFAFASEMKSLFEIPDLDKCLDYEALDQFFTYEYCLAPKTPVKSISKLLPGHFLLYNGDRVTIKRYWEITKKEAVYDEQTAESDVRDILSRSVKRRMISDVPLGAFLSGGIDSSILVGLMTEHSSLPVKTFSIGFKDTSYNELHYARLVANKFNTDHHEEILDLNVFDSLDDYIYYLDEPMADVSIFPTYLVSQMARKHVTVILSGDGGDELFGGYETYIAALIAERFYDPLPSGITSGLFPFIANLLPPQKRKKGVVNRIKRFIEGGRLSHELLQYRWMTYLSQENKGNVYSANFIAHSKNNLVSEKLRDHITRYKEWDTLNQMMLTDVNVYLSEDILAKVDRMSMAVSLEARVPYLDHEVLEYAFRIQGNAKVTLGKTKMILKNAFRDYLPNEICERGKEGFSIPLKNWLQNELKERMYSVLNAGDIKETGLFAMSGIDAMMHEHVAGRKNHAHTLWPLMVFMMWWKRYIKKS